MALRLLSRNGVVPLISNPPPPSPSSSGRPCGEILVLLIDDDETFRTALSEILRDDGHAVQAYRSVAEVPPFRDLPASSVLITDYQLGGAENGLTLAHRFNAAHPGAAVIVVTAYASHHLEQSVASVPSVSLVHKPVRYEELHRLLHERTDQPACQCETSEPPQTSDDDRRR